jgi:hypothetical protein
MLVDQKYLYKSRDRHGNLRVYFRRGPKKIRIRERLGSPEFMAVYNALLQASGSIPTLAGGAQLGTLKWLCQQYFKSSAFRQLDDRTQHVRMLVLEGAWAEPTQPGGVRRHGKVPPRRHEELPPPRLAEESRYERRTNH